MLRVGLTLAALAGLALPATAAPPSPDPKSLAVPQEELSKARELVRKLGSEAYREREDAERDLAAMGRAARAALIDGVTVDTDPEIRARCRVLLPKATAAEMKVRLETFLADTEAKYEHDLPGWNQLRAVVRGEWRMLGWTYIARPRTDKAARELFVEFLNAPNGRKLLTALGTGASDLGPVVAALKQELYNARLNRPGSGVAARTPSAMEVAVVVFADSQANYKGTGARGNLFTTVLTSSGFIQATHGTDDKSAALRAVLDAWLDTRTDPMEMYYAMNLAGTQNDAAAGRLAVRLLGAPAQGVYKGQALATIVRLKMVDQLPALEKAFSDTSAVTTTIKVVNGVQTRQSIELRDAALAAALVMTGQDPDDYGFEAFPKLANGNFSYSYARIADEKRKAAFEKWKEWREKNP